jgi:sporulation protein YlmC with PRC-barrel domain
MRVDVGQNVISRDGKKIGTVAGFVLDAGTKEIRRLVIGGGHFGDDRLADYSVISSSAADGVHVDLTAEAAQHLPIFFKQEHVVAQASDPMDVIMPATGMGGPIFYESATGGSSYPDSSSFFVAAPIDPPVVEIRSNLGDTEVMLRKGTDVVGDDGHKVGEIDEVVVSDHGHIEAFVVKAGFLFKHDVRVPLAWVSEVDDDRVLLNVSASEAERQGRV